MNRSTTLIAAAAATALLAAPAGASAAGKTVVAGPLKAKGYDITLTATDNGASDSFGVTASKTAGGSTQMHSWSFGSGVAVSVKGGKATIKGSLGRYGAINATVKTGRSGKGVVPKGCTGTPGSTRAGTLTGKTKLALDTTFFKTLTPKSLKAQIVAGGSLTCGGNSQPTGTKGLMLTHSAETEDGQIMLSITKAAGKVNQMVMRNDAAAKTAPATVFHMITASAGASGLDASSDLTSATAAGAGPFLSGTLSFAGEAAGGTMASGTLSGGFTAKFDSIPAFSPAPGADAMLMQQ
jgi:hypothetical protein